MDKNIDYNLLRYCFDYIMRMLFEVIQSMSFSCYISLGIFIVQRAEFDLELEHPTSVYNTLENKFEN